MESEKKIPSLEKIMITNPESGKKPSLKKEKEKERERNMGKHKLYSWMWKPTEPSNESKLQSEGEQLKERLKV